MSAPQPTIRVRVDLTNPGQFFACCGLLELADRLWPGAEGWFEADVFCILSEDTLSELLQAITAVKLEQLDPDDDTASPIRMSEPFGITLNWWTDEISGGKQLKVWAGRMSGIRIAIAMKQAISDVTNPKCLFDYAAVVYDPRQRNKKVEPFYFDARRGWNAQSLDIGFAPDSLSMTTKAFPAVEFLCLVGLQRCRPIPTKVRRVFEFHTWASPIPTSVIPSAVCGACTAPESAIYRFQNAFRTDQKKHKSFLPATRLGD